MDIRVAVFEDNKLVRDALGAILNGTTGYVCCGIFADGNNWEKNIRQSVPDVVLMDIEMPGISGIEATKHIHDMFPQIKILIQTVFDNDSDKIFRALCAGASGYILKNDPPHKYLEAIAEVYNGGSYINAGVARKILNFFTNKNVMLVIPKTEEYSLTPREKEILQYLAENCSLKVIGEALFISTETVRTHVKHIYKKLHVANRTEAVLKATQQGLV